MPAQPEAFFLPADGGRRGQRFCLFHPAQGDVPKGCVLYIHPFAEEMNKSRRMAALQARALAKAGYAVLQLDLLGCGDSSGDFGDASWQAWVGDVVQACHWLRARTQRRGPATDPAAAEADTDAIADAPAPQLWLWGLRAGCLLAADAARQLAAPCNFLFWAPTPTGKVQLQQFLRLKAAGDMLGGGAKGVTEGLRQQLAAGTTVEVAGYAIAPALAQGMEHAVLEPPAAAAAHTGMVRHAGAASGAAPAMATPAAMASPPVPDEAAPRASPTRVEWFELSTREDATLSPVAQKAVDTWRQRGFAVRSHIVNGPAFWQTTEIEDAPALVAATVAAMSHLPLPQEAVAA